MAGSRPGVMLYFETLQAVEELEAEDAKQIMSAILRYSRDGETPTFRGTLAALWSLIQSSLDRDGTRYDEKQMRGLWLTYRRKCKSTGKDPLGFDEWASIQHDNDTLHYVERTVDGAVNGTSPSTSPTASVWKAHGEALHLRRVFIYAAAHRGPHSGYNWLQEGNKVLCDGVPLRCGLDDPKTYPVSRGIFGALYLKAGGGRRKPVRERVCYGVGG